MRLITALDPSGKEGRVHVRHCFVVAGNVVDTGHVDWSFTRHVPDHFLGLPYGRLYRQGSRWWMEVSGIQPPESWCADSGSNASQSLRDSDVTALGYSRIDDQVILLICREDFDYLTGLLGDNPTGAPFLVVEVDGDIATSRR